MDSHVHAFADSTFFLFIPTLPQSRARTRSRIVNELFYEGELEDGVAEADRPPLLATATAAPPDARAHAKTAADRNERKGEKEGDGEGEEEGFTLVNAAPVPAAAAAASSMSVLRLPPLVFVDVSAGQEIGADSGSNAGAGAGLSASSSAGAPVASATGSLWNHAEACAVRDLVVELVRSKGVHPSRIGPLDGCSCTAAARRLLGCMLALFHPHFFVSFARRARRRDLSVPDAGAARPELATPGTAAAAAADCTRARSRMQQWQKQHAQHLVQQRRRQRPRGVECG
jgi:hypothetical protein